MPDVLLLVTIIFALLHLACGLTSICVGAVSCSQSHELRAHNVSPVWSGICVSRLQYCLCKKGSPYSITERRVPELIPVLGSQPAGDVSHKPDGRLPVILSARPAVTPATLKRAATNFDAW